MVKGNEAALRKAQEMEESERDIQEMNDMTALSSTLEHSGIFENLYYCRQSQFRHFEHFAHKERSVCTQTRKNDEEMTFT